MALCRKGITVVLSLVLVLLISSPNAFAAYLYSWPSPLPLSDPTSPASGEPNQAGWDITGAWWAHSGGSYFFRMDLLGWPENSTTYGIYFDTTNPGGGTVNGGELVLNGIDLFASVMFSSGTGFGALSLSEWNGSAFVGTEPVQPFIFAFSSVIEDGTTVYQLEWQIAESNIGSDPFTWWAATSNSGQLKDITAPVVVPIPNVAWLLGSGIVALAVLKRRRPTT